MTCLCCGSTETRPFLEHTEAGNAYAPRSILYEKCSVCQTIRKLPSPELPILNVDDETRPKQCWDSAAAWMKGSLGGSVRNAIDVSSQSLSMFDALSGAGVAIQKKSILDAQPRAGEAMPAWLGQGFSSQHQYDLVIAAHVLEHTTDPRDFLRDVRLMMFAGGWLYLEVPSLELGSSDLGSADDICPSHLWHFTLSGLSTLLSSSGFVVLKLESDPSVAWWPCNRVLAKARNWEVEPFKDLYDSTRSIYEIATAKITNQYRPGDALYAACNSAFRLHDHDPHLRGTVRSMPIYDLYKSGPFLGRFIKKPDQMIQDGIKRLWLTTRFWNSKQEITKWLKLTYPKVEVLSPYAESVE